MASDTEIAEAAREWGRCTRRERRAVRALFRGDEISRRELDGAEKALFEAEVRLFALLRDEGESTE